MQINQPRNQQTMQSLPHPKRRQIVPDPRFFCQFDGQPLEGRYGLAALCGHLAKIWPMPSAKALVAVEMEIVVSCDRRWGTDVGLG